MRFVPIKTDDQLDLQAIHRVRDRLVSRRTAVINQIRAFLLERGMVFAQKPAKLKAAMAEVLGNAENELTPMMRNLIGILWDEWKTVELQIEELTGRLEQIAASDAGCCRIRQIPGIGPIAEYIAADLSLARTKPCSHPADHTLSRLIGCSKSDLAIMHELTARR
jgi:transposase